MWCRISFVHGIVWNRILSISNMHAITQPQRRSNIKLNVPAVHEVLVSSNPQWNWSMIWFLTLSEMLYEVKGSFHSVHAKLQRWLSNKAHELKHGQIEGDDCNKLHSERLDMVLRLSRLEDSKDFHLKSPKKLVAFQRHLFVWTPPREPKSGMERQTFLKPF